MDEEMEDCEHSLAPDAHGSMQISHQHLCRGQWQTTRFLGISYKYLNYCSTRSGRFRDKSREP